VNEDFESMRNEAVVASFKALSRHLSGGTEENYEYISQDNWSPYQALNPGPPKYEAGVLTTLPRRSVYFILMIIFNKVL
jgi:hypothetical protein